MTEKIPTIQVIMLPRDTNPQGTIFGGILLSHLDLAGGAEARKHANKTFVTVGMKEVDFIAPVFVGDIVSFYTRTISVGTTSVSVEIKVEATRAHNNKEVVPVTEAVVTYVAVDRDRRPIPVLEP